MEILSARERLFSEDTSNTINQKKLRDQKEGMEKLAKIIQLEQEAYVVKHPEIMAMLKIFTLKLLHNKPRNNKILEHAALHFTRPIEVIEREITHFLKIPHVFNGHQKKTGEQEVLYNDIFDHDTISLASVTATLSEESTPITESSSFVSAITSATTLPTLEPVPTPELTLSEWIFDMIIKNFDKAIFINVKDHDLFCDTAYIAVVRAIEEAMELSVQEVKEDIIDLLKEAFVGVELIIAYDEKIAADLLYQKRIRKKLKRKMRYQKNFKGYESPSVPKTDSHQEKALKPCKCYIKGTYNRYPKDRFGIYLPRNVHFEKESITLHPDDPSVSSSL